MIRTLKLLVLLLMLSWQTAGADERPNIVFLLTDDQVDVSVGAYGNDQVKTPNMDQLAADGVLFRNHYNTTSICMASRAICMTGMYEYKTGCNFKHGPLREGAWAKSYPMLLREAGYFTGFAGKFGFNITDQESGRTGGGTLKHERGAELFDVWCGGQGQTTYNTRGRNNHPSLAKYASNYPHVSRAYGAWAHDFIATAKESGKPFCLSISFKAPHLPFTPDPAFDDVYAKTTFRKPANYGAKHAAHLAPQSKMGRQFTSYRFWVDSEESYQKTMRLYNQLIHGVDAALGMIRKSLKEQGVADNTVIIFTSDNGYNCGAHGFGGKVLPYEEGSRSPLIIFDPRLSSKAHGARRETVTGNIDMAPTILDLAGVPVPKNVDGISLVPLLTEANPKSVSRPSVALMNIWDGGNQALSVVTQDWKYIFWFIGAEAAPTEELFHLAEDRWEMKNLAGDVAFAKQLDTMRHLYDKHFKHLKDEGVNSHGYQPYKVLLDRHIPWSNKAQLWKQGAGPRKAKSAQ